jgi:hypothetical protein
VICLRASVEFCKIGTAIQDRFARAPLISCREILDFDSQLLAWESGIPDLVQEAGISSHHPQIRASAGLLQNRYLNLRLVLFRPRLLTTCLKRTQERVLLNEERQVVTTCRNIADTIVQEIANNWFENQISSWNAVWVLFQSCMIPLLSLFSDPTHEDVGLWRKNVEQALSLFEGMREFSLAAARSREVVMKIFEASQHVSSSSPNVIQHFEDTENLFWDDPNFWPLSNDLDWLTQPEFGEVTFDMSHLLETYSGNGKYGIDDRPDV